jgi:hypothetical protein
VSVFSILSSGTFIGSVGSSYFTICSNSFSLGGAICNSNGANVLISSTVAGTSSASKMDGVGTSSRFNAPADVGVDSLGNIIVADLGNHLIRKIDTAGDFFSLFLEM